MINSKILKVHFFIINMIFFLYDLSRTKSFKLLYKYCQSFIKYDGAIFVYFTTVVLVF